MIWKMHYRLVLVEPKLVCLTRYSLLTFQWHYCLVDLKSAIEKLCCQILFNWFLVMLHDNYTIKFKIEYILKLNNGMKEEYR